MHMCLDTLVNECILFADYSNTNIPNITISIFFSANWRRTALATHNRSDSLNSHYQ